MDELYEGIPDDLACSVAEDSDMEMITIESVADELWIFVGRKYNKQWLWLVFDRRSRQVMAMDVGSRGEKGARELWQALPEAHRQQATFYTNGRPRDDWAAHWCRRSSPQDSIASARLRRTLTISSVSSVRYDSGARGWFD